MGILTVLTPDGSPRHYCWDAADGEATEIAIQIFDGLIEEDYTAFEVSDSFPVRWISVFNTGARHILMQPSRQPHVLGLRFGYAGLAPYPDTNPDPKEEVAHGTVRV